MAMSPENERKMRRNWSLLKQELPVDALTQAFVEGGIFPPNLRAEIMNVIPNTDSMKAEKLLNAVIQGGDHIYDAMCAFVLANPNTFTRVIDALNLPIRIAVNPTSRNQRTGNGNAAGASSNDSMMAQAESRPSTAVSSTSSGTINSETGEKHRRVVRNVGLQPDECPEYAPNGAPVACVAPQVAYPVMGAHGGSGTGHNQVYQRRMDTGNESANATPQALFVESRIGESMIGSSRDSHSEMSLASYNSDSTDDSTPSVSPQVMMGAGAGAGANGIDPGTAPGPETPVDMKVLEQELVRIAPTIADLFKKIAVQTSSIPTSEEELQKVKDENERLRKTNKTLIDKLNAFQQKIIQLQLDNKKLKQNGEMGRQKKDELKQKAAELQDMERRLDEHKRALQEKEQELNTQLEKLREIEEENEEQRQKIDKLEELQDEGIMERNIQQEQISTLVEEKERQKDQIESLEEQQKIGEHRLYSLEERLKNLEQGPRRQGRNRRVMSPPRSNYWMNGVVDRSHHANVKFQSEIKFDPQRNGKRTSSTGGKAGWPFI